VLRRLKQFLDALGFEPLLYLALFATGLTGAALALFLGKLFAAAILGALCVGFFLRFKRGRIRKNTGRQYAAQSGRLRLLAVLSDLLERRANGFDARHDARSRPLDQVGIDVA
jgi:hypothetical protein